MDSTVSQASTTAELLVAQDTALLAGQPQQRPAEAGIWPRTTAAGTLTAELQQQNVLQQHGNHQRTPGGPSAAAYPSPVQDPTTRPAQKHLPAQHAQHNGTEAAATAGPPSDWMFQCCSDMHLRDMFLPGSHDTGTYMWTTPKHMPMVLDEILSILFNIVGDLSRTQRLDVHE